LTPRRTGPWASAAAGPTSHLLACRVVAGPGRGRVTRLRTGWDGTGERSEPGLALIDRWRRHLLARRLRAVWAQPADRRFQQPDVGAHPVLPHLRHRPHDLRVRPAGGPALGGRGRYVGGTRTTPCQRPSTGDRPRGTARSFRADRKAPHRGATRGRHCVRHPRRHHIVGVRHRPPLIARSTALRPAPERQSYPSLTREPPGHPLGGSRPAQSRCGTLAVVSDRSRTSRVIRHSGHGDGRRGGILRRAGDDPPGNHAAIRGSPRLRTGELCRRRDERWSDLGQRGDRVRRHGRARRRGLARDRLSVGAVDLDGSVLCITSPFNPTAADVNVRGVISQLHDDRVISAQFTATAPCKWLGAWSVRIAGTRTERFKVGSARVTAWGYERTDPIPDDGERWVTDVDLVRPRAERRARTRIQADASSCAIILERQNGHPPKAATPAQFSWLDVPNEADRVERSLGRLADRLGNRLRQKPPHRTPCRRCGPLESRGCG
jgi:hypothetical protein